MLVKTPAMRIDLRVETVKVDGEQLVFEGIAGFLPCEMRAGAPELRALLRLAPAAHPVVAAARQGLTKEIPSCADT